MGIVHVGTSPVRHLSRLCSIRHPRSDFQQYGIPQGEVLHTILLGRIGDLEEKWRGLTRRKRRGAFVLNGEALGLDGIDGMHGKSRHWVGA